MIDLKNFQIPLITPVSIYKVFTFLDNFKPEIIHAQNAILVSKMIQMWSVINSVPFVITYHHVPTEAVYHLAPSLKKNIFGNIAQEIYKNTSLKSTLNATDGVIAVNKAIEKSVRTVNKDIKLKIINNGIEVEKLKNIKTTKINKSNIRFVFLGSFNERKNQLFLVRVFGKLDNNYILSLYGKRSTGGDYLKKIEDYINTNDIKNVKIYDYEKDISKVFNANDFLISASKKEAQSLVVIQSMVAGKPVIGLKNETLDELIDETCGLVLQKNITPSEFSKKVVNFIKSMNYESLSKNIRINSEKFDINKVTSEMEKFYNAICKTYSNNSRGNIGKYYNNILKKISIVQK